MKIKLLIVLILIFSGRCMAQFPTANFSSSDDTICVNGCITCSDLSVAGADPITAWAWTFSGGNPSGSSLQNPPAACYSVAGTYALILIITDLNGRSDTASKTITAEACSGINNPSAGTQVSIYPNPAEGGVVISSEANSCQIEFYNALGEKVYFDKINSGRSEIDLSTQPKGIYLIKASSEKGVTTQKLILH